MKWIIVVLLFALCIGFILIKLYSLHTNYTRTGFVFVRNDVAKYERYLADVKLRSEHKDLVTHFPIHIPEYATSVKVLVGIKPQNCIQLRFSSPIPTAESLLKTLTASAKQIQDGYVFKKGNLLKFYTTPDGPYDSDESHFGLSSEFALLVLYTAPVDSDKAVDWEKEYSGGVAINKKTGEIIYWVITF
jgi:hypothetical protein